MSVRKLSLCNAGVLRAVDRLWGKDGSQPLIKDADLPQLGRDLKQELKDRGCFTEMPELFQELIKNFAEMPLPKVQHKPMLM